MAAKLIGRTTDKVVDLALKQPSAAKTHRYTAATSESSVAYREKLGNISATAETVDNVLNVATDPKKMLGLVLFIGVLCLVFWLMREKMKSYLSPVWKALFVQPFSIWKNIRETEKRGGKVGEIRIDVKAIAESLARSFGFINDDELSIESNLKQISNDSEWLAVVEEFGEQNYRTWDHPIAGENFTLPAAIKKFADDTAELNRWRSILTENGITPSILGF